MRLPALLSVLLLLAGCGNGNLEPWHEVQLEEEFTSARDEVDSFDDYLELEQRLFTELGREIYAQQPLGQDESLNRFSSGSAADPTGFEHNWNRSFELQGEASRGGVLLLHGMSDSPYSLRALGQRLHAEGFQVLGLRLPGHGTAPVGLTDVSWQDMAAAVDLAMAHLQGEVGEAPLHIIGYSTGAPLALNYTLDAEQDASRQVPASLVLISPAIGISPAAGLATWKRRLAALPGLESLAWLSIEPEFDPYKYNSFATNAAEQVFRLTRHVSRRMSARNDSERPLPPILVFKSAVDATVATGAVVDSLLKRLTRDRHELVLFDINRLALAAPLLVADPGPFTRQLMQDGQLPFALTLVENETPQSRTVAATYKPPFAAQASEREALGLEWPRGMVSQSHVSIPFPPEDPLYGRYPPAEAGRLFLGDIPLKGERGLLRISPDWLLRLRHNPFYSYLEQRSLEWITN